MFHPMIIFIAIINHCNSCWIISKPYPLFFIYKNIIDIISIHFIITLIISNNVIFQFTGIYVNFIHPHSFRCNQKAKSLVHWIEKWESDGVTKIDGIGTQMHVSCYANAATQKSKEDHVVKMFEILAESGKLVKISELDMGYIDENNTSVKTENMTEAQHKAMAEYYKFIVKKYFVHSCYIRICTDYCGKVL